MPRAPLLGRGRSPREIDEWSWAGGKRRAFFQEDRLVRWER